MTDNELIKQNLHCPICLLIVDEPWETSCCGTLFCEKCKKEIQNNKCPICRRVNYTFRKTLFVKELLAKVEMKCQNGCEEMIKLNRIKIHKYECEKAKFRCSINKCQWEGNKSDALEHLVENHSEILAIVSENYQSLKPVYNKFDVIGKIMLERRNEKKKEQSDFMIKDASDKKSIDTSNVMKKTTQMYSDKETELSHSDSKSEIDLNLIN